MTRKTKERHQQGSSSTTNGTVEAGESGQNNKSNNNGQQHKSEQQITISMSPGAQQVLEQQLKMGKGNSGGGEQMKLVAHLEMTFVGDGGDGQPKVIHRKASKQFVPAETDKSKSRSPIALHQRCGLPMPVGVGAGGEEQDTATIAHSTKTLKKQQQQMMAGNSSGGGSGKKNSTTIAHGQLGPLSITVRACKPGGGGGGGSTAAGHEDSEEEGGQENNNNGKRMMGGQQKAMMGNGGSGGGGGSTSAGAATGQLDMEQRNVPGEPALVKIQARKVNCKSANGEMFVVDWYLMQQSRLFKRFWDDHRQALKRKPCNGRSRKFTFSMEQVDGDTFRRVLQWLVEHDGMDEPVVREDPDTGERVWFELTEFERHFFDQPLHILNAVLTAGKYLDIPSLYLFGCQSMAALIQDKSPAEIREMLGLENDLTSADIAAIRRRNRKFKMRELKAAKYANRVQQLQSQLQQMGHPQPKNGTNTAERGGSVQSSGLMMAEQLLMATGRDILTG